MALREERTSCRRLVGDHLAVLFRPAAPRRRAVAVASSGRKTGAPAPLECPSTVTRTSNPSLADLAPDDLSHAAQPEHYPSVPSRAPTSRRPRASRPRPRRRCSICCALLALEQFFRTSPCCRDLRDQDDVGAAGDPRLERDPAAYRPISSRTITRWWLSRRMELVERLGRRVHGGLEPEGHERCIEVVVDGLGTPMTGTPSFERPWPILRTRRRRSPPGLEAELADVVQDRATCLVISLPLTMSYGQRDCHGCGPRIVPPTNRIPWCSRSERPRLGRREQASNPSMIRSPPAYLKIAVFVTAG